MRCGSWNVGIPRGKLAVPVVDCAVAVFNLKTISFWHCTIDKLHVFMHCTTQQATKSQQLGNCSRSACGSSWCS